MKNYMGAKPAVAVPSSTMPSVSGEEQGVNVRPSRQMSKSAAPGGYSTSGMERAMGAHADKLHPVRGC